MEEAKGVNPTAAGIVAVEARDIMVVLSVDVVVIYVEVSIEVSITVVVKSNDVSDQVLVVMDTVVFVVVHFLLGVTVTIFTKCSVEVALMTIVDVVLLVPMSVLWAPYLVRHIVVEKRDSFIGNATVDEKNVKAKSAVRNDFIVGDWPCK